MKKTILVSMAFVAIMTMASCGGKLNLNKSVKLETPDDSLSYVLGVTTGGSLGDAVKSGMYPELQGFDADDFVKGVAAAFDTDTTREFYDMGLMQGMQIKNTIVAMREQYGLELDPSTAVIALQKAIEGDTTLLIPSNQANRVAQAIIEAAQAKKEKEELDRLAAAPEAQENLAKGVAFLAEKEKEAGVVKTESGLLYKVVKAGKGEKVQENQRAKVAYKGSLIDGTQFDANESASFSPRSVVPGFGEGLQLMQKGGEYILYIPAELGYGVRGAGDKVPANSVLVFEVKVLDIQ